MTNDTQEIQKDSVFKDSDFEFIKNRNSELGILESNLTNHLLVKLRGSYKSEYALDKKQSDQDSQDGETQNYSKQVDLTKLSDPQVLDKVFQSITQDSQCFRFWQQDIQAALEKILQKINKSADPDDEDESFNIEIVKTINLILSNCDLTQEAYQEIIGILNTQDMVTNSKSIKPLTRSDKDWKYSDESTLKKTAKRLVAWLGNSQQAARRASELPNRQLSKKQALSMLTNLNQTIDKHYGALGIIKAELIEIAQAKKFLKDKANISFKDIQDFFLKLVGSIVTPLGKPTLFGGFLLMVLFASFSFGVKQKTGIFIGQFQNWHSWLEVLIQHAHILVVTISLSVLVFTLILLVEYFRSKNPKQLKHQNLLHAHANTYQDEYKEALSARLMIKISILCVLISGSTGYYFSRDLDDYATEITFENPEDKLSVLRLGNAFLTNNDGVYSAHTATDFDELLKFNLPKPEGPIVNIPKDGLIDGLQTLLGQQQQFFNQYQMDQRIVVQKLQEQLYKLGHIMESKNSAHTFNFHSQVPEQTSTDPQTIIIEKTDDGIFTLPLTVFHSANDETLEFSDKLFITLRLLEYLGPAKACSGVNDEGWLRVSAYADSACYHNNCDNQSHYNNLELANRRIQAVSDFVMTEMHSSDFIERVNKFYGIKNSKVVVSNILNLNAKIDQEFKITRKIWPSYVCHKSFSELDSDACVEARDYLQYKAGINDRNESSIEVVNSDGYNEDSGEFNRRAEITLMSRPSCKGKVSFASES